MSARGFVRSLLWVTAYTHYDINFYKINLPVPIPIGRREKVRFLFSHFFVVPHKVFKAFIKPFEAPQRSVKIKNLTFISIQLSEMHGTGRDKT